MSGPKSIGWAEVLPGHLPVVQVLDRLLGAGWPDRDAPEGLMAEARFFLPHLLGGNPDARAFLEAELSADAEGVRARLAFLRAAMRDVALHGDLIFADIDAFMARAETFALFDYSQAREVTPAALAATRPWVTYMAGLTRAEAPCLVPLLGLPHGAAVLEPGGNGGAFARAVIAAWRPADYAVLDLPAVCAIGAGAGVADGLRFVAGDFRRDDWRGQAGLVPDVVLFKSVLHDWPEADSMALLARALAALGPEGQINICERVAFGGMETGSALDYGNLVFAPFYRDPDAYAAMLAALDPALAVTVQRTRIDTGWFVLTARRGG